MKEKSFLFEAVEAAKERVAYLENATYTQLHEWKLNQAFEFLIADMAEEACPRDRHEWIPEEGEEMCEECKQSNLMRFLQPRACWKEWAFAQVEGYISQSKYVASLDIEEEG